MKFDNHHFLLSYLCSTHQYLSNNIYMLYKIWGECMGSWAHCPWRWAHCFPQWAQHVSRHPEVAEGRDGAGRHVSTHMNEWSGELALVSHEVFQRLHTKAFDNYHFFYYIHIILINASPIIYTSYIKHDENVWKSELTVWDDELDMEIMSSMWKTVRSRHSEVTEKRVTCGGSHMDKWPVNRLWFPGKPGIPRDRRHKNIL